MKLSRGLWLLLAIAILLSISTAVCRAEGCDNLATSGPTPSYITSITPNVWQAGNTYNVVITGFFNGNTPPYPGCAFDEIYVNYATAFDDGFYLYADYPGETYGSVQYGGGNYTPQYLTTSVASYLNNGTNQIGFTITVAPDAPSGVVDIDAGCDGGCTEAEGTVQINGVSKNTGNPCDIPGSNAAGDPISICSGNVFEEVTDYETAGQNKLSYIRYYNSLSVVGTNATELGSNWRSNYDRYLQVISNSVITAERPDGQEINFYNNGSSWTPDSDVDYTLTQSGSTWTLTDHNDVTEVYSTVTDMVDGLTVGLLQSITLRDGYAQTMTYNPSNQLTSVTDSYNRQLTFTYSNGTVSTVTTPDSLALTYGYNTVYTTNDQLISVTYSTSPETNQQYLYQNTNLPYALTSIVDEDGNTYKSWTYDSYQRGLTSQTGGLANLYTVTYNDTNNTRTVTNAFGVTDTYTLAYLQNDYKITNVSRAATSNTAASTETFAYDSNGYLSNETDWNGNQTAFINDTHGDPTTINEAVSSSVARTTTIAYDSTWVHLPDTITTPGLATAFTYDDNGDVLTKTLTDTTSSSTRVWQYTWQNSLLATVRSPRTDVVEKTTYAYDSTGALTGITNPLNQQTTITSHTGGGLPQTIVDPNGVTTTLAYDTRLHLLSSTTAGHVTSYGYDAAENLTSVTQPDGSSLSYTYDTAHRLTAITDLLGERITYTLDALGDHTATSITNSSNSVTYQHSNTFDALGRMLQDIGASSQTASFAYDAVGNMVTATDQASNATQRAFDALNRVYQITDPSGGFTITSYDAHDRPLSVSSPNGVATTYVYDGFGDVTQESNPNTGTTVYFYDSTGNRITRTAATGAVTQYTYDALDRVLTMTFPSDSAENVTYTYDQTGHGSGIGKLTSVSDAVGSLSRSYDQWGNLLGDVRTTSAATLTTGYTYDPANRIASITYPSGTAVSYTRDTMGQVTAMAEQFNGGTSTPIVSNVAYEPFGPSTTYTYGNGIAETYSFDQDYRITGIVGFYTDFDSPDQNLAYTYYPTNNVQTVTDYSTGYTSNSQSFSYDSLQRLSQATGNYGTFGFTYDGDGNQLTQMQGPTPITYGYGTGSDLLSTISTEGVATQAIGYTADGRIASLNPGIQAALTGQYITSLSYNQDGQLAAANSGSGALASYTYDGFGQRLVQIDPSSFGETYQYGQDGLLLEEMDSYSPASFEYTVDYVYLNGRPVAEFDVYNGSSSSLYFETDRIGAPQLGTDSEQKSWWDASYEPFGQLSWGGGKITQSLRLPGQVIDDDTNWIHNGFRDYIPDLGRYIEPDPLGRLGSGNNLYVYVNDNPTNLTDPSGLCPSGKVVSESSLAGMFLCGVGGIPGQLANLFGGTWGIGLGGSAGIGEGLLGIGGEGGLQIVADPQGNVGILATGGVALAPATGVVAGAGALGGGQLSVTFTKSIYNLTGAGWDAGGSVADGLGGGIDVSKGLEPGSPWTITGTAGFGVGGKGGLTSFTGSKMLISTNCKGIWGW